MVTRNVLLIVVSVFCTPLLHAQMAPEDARALMVEKERSEAVLQIESGNATAWKAHEESYSSDEMRRIASALSRLATKLKGEIASLAAENIQIKNHNAQLQQELELLRAEAKKREPVPINGDAAARIEELKLFPDRYVGKTLVFRKCTISGELNKISKNAFTVTVESPEGTRTAHIAIQNEAVFIVDTIVAAEMTKHRAQGHSWPNCTIQCSVVRDGEYFYAWIDSIDVFNYGGKVALQFRAKREEQ